MIIKILDIIPVIYSEALEITLKDRREFVRKLSEKTNHLVQLDIVNVEDGSTSIEDMYDEVMSLPYIIKKIKLAEELGYHAVVIDCFFDPGLDVARELVKIPVIGPAQSACHLAAQVGERFSVILPSTKGEPIVRDRLKRYELHHNLASIRSVNLSVLELQTKPEETLSRVSEEARKAFLNDGAHVLVLGCTGMSWLFERLESLLKERYNLEVPVIEPFRAAVYNAVMWVLYGVTHSKTRYPTPLIKP